MDWYIFLIFCMDLLKLLHGFVKVVFVSQYHSDHCNTTLIITIPLLIIVISWYHSYHRNITLIIAMSCWTYECYSEIINITLIIAISLWSSQYHSDHHNITLIIEISLWSSQYHSDQRNFVTEQQQAVRRNGDFLVGWKLFFSCVKSASQHIKSYSKVKRTPKKSRKAGHMGTDLSLVLSSPSSPSPSPSSPPSRTGKRFLF